MPPEQTANPLLQMIPMLLIFLVFYFLLIKPERDRKNELKKMTENLKKNDQVVTTSGIHGTVVNVKDTTVILRIDDNAKIEMDKEAISVIKKTASSS